jgi:tricorn protease
MNAAYFDAYGWSVENHGVDPDIDALRTPLDWAEGRHGQMEVAVRTALTLLNEHPAATPPDLSTRPTRKRPLLPPR